MVSLTAVEEEILKHIKPLEVELLAVAVPEIWPRKVK